MDHHSWLVAWLYQRVNCPEMASDLAHDTFLRLLLKPLREDVEYSRNYLKKIADGLWIDVWRRRQLEQAWLESVALWPTNTAPSAEHQNIILETLCEIDAMLGDLPEKVRHAFVCSQFRGWTYSQIATELAVSERMVKKYMAQAFFQCALIARELPGRHA